MVLFFFDFGTTLSTVTFLAATCLTAVCLTTATYFRINSWSKSRAFVTFGGLPLFLGVKDCSDDNASYWSETVGSVGSISVLYTLR